MMDPMKVSVAPENESESIFFKKVETIQEIHDFAQQTPRKSKTVLNLDLHNKTPFSFYEFIKPQAVTQKPK